MTDLYVYYQVREEHATELAPRVRAMQAGLAVPCQLKRRPESKNGLQTWMEVYPACGGDFSAQLADAVDAAGIMDRIEGPRHTEVFTELVPCA